MDNSIKQRKSKLLVASICKLYIAVLIIAIVLFISSGTLQFWNAWIFIGVFVLLNTFSIFYLYITDLELLSKRINTKEKEGAQKLFTLVYYLFAVIIFVVSGLNYRYHWSVLKIWTIAAAAVVMIFGFYISTLVMKQNSYASRVVEVQEDQKVIDTGMYSIVRHPMYLSAILYYCPVPLMLGSIHVFILSIVIVPAILVFRIVNEEKLLKEELNGYTEYMKKVKYKLIPFIW